MVTGETLVRWALMATKSLQVVAGRIGNGTFSTEALLASGGSEDGCLGAVSSEGSRGDGGGDMQSMKETYV
jgi:hypothetical protein